MSEHPLQIFAIVVITVVGMGRGHHMGDAVGRRRPAHGDLNVPGFRSVVYFRQDVRVNVDHNCRNPSSLVTTALSSRFNQIRGQRERCERSGTCGYRTLEAEPAQKKTMVRAKAQRKLIPWFFFAILCGFSSSTSRSKLLVSFLNEISDRPVGLGQRLLIG